jgi:capsular polysaccharide biosynthesis protein
MLKARVGPSHPPIALSVVNELEVLPRRSNLLEDSHADAVQCLTPAEPVAEEIVRRATEGHAAGEPIPIWADGAGGTLRAGVHVSRIHDAWHAPAFGAVMNAKGQVFRSSVQEALYVMPNLASLPHTRIEDGSPLFRPPLDLPTMQRAGVFMAWGGQHNYGHFLLDCLPALWSVRQVDPEGRYPLISPRLSPWQFEMTRLVTDTPIQQVAEPLIRIEDVLFSSCMDHFLHTPNDPLRAIARHLRDKIGPIDGPKRIYISRRHDSKRTLINEAELEQALATLGFSIYHPATMSVAEQVKVFSGAEIIASPTGAALANVLFAPKGAKIFEIQPKNFTGVWVRNICLLQEQDWYGFFSRSPIMSETVTIGGNDHGNIHFEWLVDIDAFTNFISTHIE